MTCLTKFKDIIKNYRNNGSFINNLTKEVINIRNSTINEISKEDADFLITYKTPEYYNHQYKLSVIPSVIFLLDELNFVDISDSAFDVICTLYKNYKQTTNISYFSKIIKFRYQNKKLDDSIVHLLINQFYKIVQDYPYIVPVNEKGLIWAVTYDRVELLKFLHLQKLEITEKVVETCLRHNAGECFEYIAQSNIVEIDDTDSKDAIMSFNVKHKKIFNVLFAKHKPNKQDINNAINTNNLDILIKYGYKPTKEDLAFVEQMGVGETQIQYNKDYTTANLVYKRAEDNHRRAGRAHGIHNHQGPDPGAHPP